jgi:hypothetical protein
MENKYLINTILLQEVTPILKRFGVDSDAYLTEQGTVLTHEAFIVGLKNGSYTKDRLKNLLETYRSDTLENVLPEWCWGWDADIWEGEPCLTVHYANERYHRGEWGMQDIEHAVIDAICSKPGQPKLEALAKLVILLDENGLLEEKE